MMVCVFRRDGALLFILPICALFVCTFPCGAFSHLERSSLQSSLEKCLGKGLFDSQIEGQQLSFEK